MSQSTYEYMVGAMGIEKEALGVPILCLMTILTIS